MEMNWKRALNGLEIYLDIFRQLHMFFSVSLRWKCLKIVYLARTNLHNDVSYDSGFSFEYSYSNRHFVKMQLIALCSVE